MALLKLENISVDYGCIHALKDVNIELNSGEVVTLIGANGAGKSTTMKAIMGIVHCKTGHIFYNDEEITNKSTQSIVNKGIILTPEGRQVFPRYSVEDNLMLGAYTRTKEEALKTLEEVYALLPKLKDRNRQAAGSLSGGEQQMLAIGRAMMASPKLLLLDEPSLGLAPIIVNEIFTMIDNISKAGVTILLVEQNAHVALKHSDRAYVIETGKLVLSGNAEELLGSEEIRKAYFGGL